MAAAGGSARGIALGRGWSTVELVPRRVLGERRARPDPRSAELAPRGVRVNAICPGAVLFPAHYDERKRRRIIAGGVTLAVGTLALLYGFVADDIPAARLFGSLGLGALLSFIGVNLLSPLIVRPVARFIAWPIRAVYRVPGRLARAAGGQYGGVQ